jgi:hypothetical protein
MISIKLNEVVLMKKKLLILSISLCTALYLMAGGFAAWGDKLEVSFNIKGAAIFPDELVLTKTKLTKTKLTKIDVERADRKNTTASSITTTTAINTEDYTTPIIDIEKNNNSSNLKITIGSNDENWVTQAAIDVDPNKKNNN